MNWGLEDATAAALLIGAMLTAAWFIFRLVYRVLVRMILLGCVIVAGLVIWAHLAVGIF